MSVSGSPATIKREPEEGPSDVLNCDEARIKSQQALLYAHHEIKEDIMIGPTEMHRPLPGAGVLQWEGGATLHALASKCTDYEYRRMAGCRLELCDVARELLCARCSQWSLTAEQVRQHKQRACIGNKRCRLVLRDAGDELLCARCGQWSLSRAAQHTHRRTHQTTATAQVEQIPTPVLPLEGKSLQHMGTDQHPESSPTGKLQVPTLTDQRDNTSTLATLTHQLFICDLCRKRFTDRSLLAKHKHSHTQTDSCQQRDTRFVLKEDLKSILFQKVLNHSETKPFVCDECGKNFTRMDKLTRHMLIHIHTGIKLFSCEKFSKNFAQESILTQNALIHSKNKPFTCDKCGKTFVRKYALSQHVLTHSETKPFSCDECGKGFARKCDLSRHKKLIHIGSTQFSCDKCGKGFARKCDLSRHKKLIHIGSTQFSCETCGESFDRNSDLYQHVLSHSGMKPFSCDKCGKSFARKSSLPLHMIIHSGARPFSCNKCGMSFVQKGHLSRHMLTHNRNYFSKGAPTHFRPEGAHHTCSITPLVAKASLRDGNAPERARPSHRSQQPISISKTAPFCPSAPMVSTATGTVREPRVSTFAYLISSPGWLTPRPPRLSGGAIQVPSRHIIYVLNSNNLRF